MVRVKICGITNVDDALASVEAGAYALGFNFYPESPRYIHPLQARRIIEQLPTSVMKVGVFVNERRQDVERIANDANLDAVQLHGDESASYCRELKNLFVIKAFRVNDDFQPEQVTQHAADAVLLDGFSPRGYGGNGQSFDWSIALPVRRSVAKLFLAGGLNENNVAAAIAAVQPYAVDACSGLERVPGVKDLARVRSFMQAAREAEVLVGELK